MEAVSSCTLCLSLAAVLFLILVLALAAYFGVFRDVSIMTLENPPDNIIGGIPGNNQLHVLYKHATGNYKNCGKLYGEILDGMPKSGLISTIGLFYDDPKVTEESRLRYAVGAIVDPEGDAAFIREKERMGFISGTLPKPQKIAYTLFPFRNILSHFLALYKVYPKMDQYIDEIGLKTCPPCIEICDGKITKYIIPLGEQATQFVIPEFRE